MHSLAGGGPAKMSGKRPWVPRAAAANGTAAGMKLKLQQPH